MANTIRTRTLKRGPAGRLVKWAFIAFNVLMLSWVFAYWADRGDLFSAALSDTEHTRAVLTTIIGTGLIFVIWLAGGVILGLFTLATRGKTVIVEEPGE